MIESLNQLIQAFGQLNTVVLLMGLVILFVVAFKVLEMVMQTLIVSVLSGAFYLALSYYLGSVQFSIDSLLFFTFIGGSLYTGYNLITTSASLLNKIIRLPIKIIKKVIGFIKELINSKRD